MSPRKDVIPATLSFLLPGLGQVYQRRYARGVSVFLAFTLLNLLPGTRAFLVMPVAWGSWDAYRATEAAPEAGARRKWLYLATGFAGFLGWMMLLGTTILLHR